MLSDRDYALVVGIEYYPVLHADLPGAHSDATNFQEWLTGPGGLPDDGKHIELVLSKVENNDPVPAQKEIDYAFERLFNYAEADNERRRLYLYFAAHGGATGQENLAVLLADATLKNLNRSLDTAQYHAGLTCNQTIFPEQIIFYDCCRNYDERFRGRGPDWSELTADEIKKSTSNLASVEQWVFYAAGFTQYANRREIVRSMQRGLFTTALLEGLNGKAARLDGTVTTLSLAKYMKTRLEELTKPQKLSQDFNWKKLVGQEDELVLVEGIAGPLTTVKVLTPPSVERVSVSDERDEPLGSAEVLNGVATFDLSAGEYIFRVDPAPPTGRKLRAVNIPAHVEFIVEF